MLPPNELKNKKFSKVVRGYSMVEVDEHIEFIVEKYTELYRENDDLERKLRVTLNKLDIIKKDEESIRSALINAQRAGSAIINEANERAEVVMRATKTNCDKILSDFRADIRTERDRFLKLRAIVAEFKKELFNIYNTHIEYIDTINPDAGDIDDLKITEEIFVRRAITDIKKDIAENIDHITKRGNAAVQSDPEEELQKKTVTVSGQLTPPAAISETAAKTNPSLKNHVPDEAAHQSENIPDVKKAPVTEHIIPENTVIADSEPMNNFIPADDFDSAPEPDSEDEFDFEYEAEPESGEEYISEDASESENEFISDEKTAENPVPVPEKTVPAFVRGTPAAPRNTEKKGSVKDTIRELNKIFSSSGKEAEDDIKEVINADITAENTEAEDDFGAEEFEHYNPVESVKSSAPDDDGDVDESEAAESDEDKEYREFIKSIENASGNSKTDKNSGKQKKNVPKPVKKDGKEFDFI